MRGLMNRPLAAVMACIVAASGSLIFFNCAVADELDAFQGLEGRLDIAGGTAHIPVMKEAAKRIMTRYKDIVITVAGGGSGLGIKQVGEGLVDIGNSGRKPRPEEIERYNLKMYQWAIDGVGLVVNPKKSHPIHYQRAAKGDFLRQDQHLGGFRWR